MVFLCTQSLFYKFLRTRLKIFEPQVVPALEKIPPGMGITKRNEKNQKTNPLNLILGFEYIVAIIVLVLGSLGYVILK